MALREVPAPQGQRPPSVPTLLRLGGVVIPYGAEPDDGHIPSRLDAARDRGYEPHADDYRQPRTTDLGDWQAAFDASVAEAHRLKDECGVEDCGNRRCDRCDERLTCTGPEPRACGVSCADCPCDCQACLDQRADLRADLVHQIQGESA